MLLLFWRSLGLRSGTPTSIKWFHTSDDPPKCLVSCSMGVSVLNPFMEPAQECSFATLDKVCVSSDIFDGKLIVGTESDGLFYLNWDEVKRVGCDIENPTDLTDGLETFNDFSGLLSNNILRIESNGDYLGILTDTGFSYGEQGEAEYINYLTESGKDCFVCSNNYVYVAEGNRVLAKATPADFSTWDTEFGLAEEINDIWVNQKDGINTLFVATVSGVEVFEKDQHYYYESKDYTQIKAEVGATLNQGHLFAMSSNTVDILNMKSKILESSVTYSGLATVGIENKRLYSK